MGDYSYCDVSAAKDRRFCLTGLKAEPTDYHSAHLDDLLPPPSPFKTVSSGEPSTSSVRGSSSSSNSSSPVRSPTARGTCSASRFGFHRPTAVTDRLPATTARTAKCANVEALDGRSIGPAVAAGSPVDVKSINTHCVGDKMSNKDQAIVDATRRVGRNGVQRSASVDTAGHESGIGSDSDSGTRASPELLVDDRQVDFSSSSPLYSPVENSSPESRSSCRAETVSGGSRVVPVEATEVTRKQQLLKMIDPSRLKQAEYCCDPLPVLTELPEVQSPEWRHIVTAPMTPVRRLECEDVDRLIVPPPALGSLGSADRKPAATGIRIPERRIVESRTEAEVNARRRLPTVPRPSDPIIDVVTRRPPSTKRPSTSLGLPVESCRVQIALTPSAGLDSLVARRSGEMSTATKAERWLDRDVDSSVVKKETAKPPLVSLFPVAHSAILTSVEKSTSSSLRDDPMNTANVKPQTLAGRLDSSEMTDFQYSTSSVDRLERRRLPVADDTARLSYPISKHVDDGKQQRSIVDVLPAGAMDQQMATFPRARGRRNAAVQRCRSDIVDEETTCESVRADVVDSGTVGAVSSPVSRVDSFGRNDPLLRVPVRGARTAGSRPASVIPHTFRSDSLQDYNVRTADDLELTRGRLNKEDAAVHRRRPASVLLPSSSTMQSDEQSTSSATTSTIGSIVSRIGRRLTSVGVRTSSDQPKDADDVRRSDYLPASATSTWDRRLTKDSAASKDTAYACPSTALAATLSPPTPIGLDRGGSKRDSVAARTERTFGAGAAFHTFHGDITPMRWTEDETASDTRRRTGAQDFGIGSGGTFQFPDNEADQSHEQQHDATDKSNQQQQQQYNEAESVQQLETGGKSKLRSNLPSPSRQQQHPTTQQQQLQQPVARIHSELAKPLHVITDEPCFTAAVPPELSPSASKLPHSGTSKLRPPTSPPSDLHSRVAGPTVRRSSAGIPDAGLTKRQISPLSPPVALSKLPSPTERPRKTTDAAVPDPGDSARRHLSKAVAAAPTERPRKTTDAAVPDPGDNARRHLSTTVAAAPTERPRKTIDAAVPDPGDNARPHLSTAVAAAPSKLQLKMTGSRNGPSSPLEPAKSSAPTTVSTLAKRKPDKTSCVSSAPHRRPDIDEPNEADIPAVKQQLPSPSASAQLKMTKIGSPTYQPRSVGGMYFQFTSKQQQRQQQEERKSISPPIETQSQLPQKASFGAQKPTSPPPFAPSPEYRPVVELKKEPQSPTIREMIAPSKIQRGPLRSPTAASEVCRGLWERGAETSTRDQPKKTEEGQPSKIVPTAVAATASETSTGDLLGDPEQSRKMRMKAQEVIRQQQQQQQQQRLRRRSDEMPVAPPNESERNFGGVGVKGVVKKRPESFQLPLRPPYSFSSNATRGIPSPGVSSPTARSPTRYFPDPASTSRSAKGSGFAADQTTVFAVDASPVVGLKGVAEDAAGETMWAVDCTGPNVVLTTPTSTPQRDSAFKKVPLTAAGSTPQSKLSPRRQLFGSQISEPASASAAGSQYSRQTSWPTQSGSASTSGTLRSTTTTVDSCSTLRSDRVTTDWSPERHDERSYGQSMMTTPTSNQQGTSSKVGSYYSLSKATWNGSDAISPPRPYGEVLSSDNHYVKSSTPTSVRPDQSSATYLHQQAASLPRRPERPKILHSQSTVDGSSRISRQPNVGSMKDDESRFIRPSKTTPIVPEHHPQVDRAAVGSDNNVDPGGLRPHTAGGRLLTAAPFVDAKPPTGNRRHTTEVHHVSVPDSSEISTGSGEDQLDRPQSTRKIQYSTKKKERMGLFSNFGFMKSTPGGASKDRRSTEGQSNCQTNNDQLDRRTLPKSAGIFQEEVNKATVDASRTSLSAPGTPVRQETFQFGVNATPPTGCAGKTDYKTSTSCSGNPVARNCSSLGRPRTSLGLRLCPSSPDSSQLSTPTKTNVWDFQTLLSTPSTPDGSTTFQLTSLPAELLNDVEKEVTMKRYAGDTAQEEAIYDVERLIAAWDFTADNEMRGPRRRTVSNVEELHGTLTSSTSDFDDGGSRRPRELPVDCPSSSSSAQSLDVDSSPETDERRRAEFQRSVKKFITACRDLLISATTLAQSAVFDDCLTICIHWLAVLLARCRCADFGGPSASQLESRIYAVATVFGSAVDASRLSVGRPVDDAGVREMMLHCIQLRQALAKLKNAAAASSRRPPMAYL